MNKNDIIGKIVSELSTENTIILNSGLDKEKIGKVIMIQDKDSPFELALDCDSGVILGFNSNELKVALKMENITRASINHKKGRLEVSNGDISHEFKL